MRFILCLWLGLACLASSSLSGTPVFAQGLYGSHVRSPGDIKSLVDEENTNALVLQAKLEQASVANSFAEAVDAIYSFNKQMLSLYEKVRLLTAIAELVPNGGAWERALNMGMTKLESLSRRLLSNAMFRERLESAMSLVQMAGATHVEQNSEVGRVVEVGSSILEILRSHAPRLLSRDASEEVPEFDFESVGEDDELDPAIALKALWKGTEDALAATQVISLDDLDLVEVDPPGDETVPPNQIDTQNQIDAQNQISTGSSEDVYKTLSIAQVFTEMGVLFKSFLDVELQTPVTPDGDIRVSEIGAYDISVSQTGEAMGHVYIQPSFTGDFSTLMLRCYKGSEQGRGGGAVIIRVPLLREHEEASEGELAGGFPDHVLGGYPTPGSKHLSVIDERFRELPLQVAKTLVQSVAMSLPCLLGDSETASFLTTHESSSMLAISGTLFRLMSRDWSDALSGQRVTDQASDSQLFDVDSFIQLLRDSADKTSFNDLKVMRGPLSTARLGTGKERVDTGKVEIGAGKPPSGDPAETDHHSEEADDQSEEGDEPYDPLKTLVNTMIGAMVYKQGRYREKVFAAFEEYRTGEGAQRAREEAERIREETARTEGPAEGIEGLAEKIEGQVSFSDHIVFAGDIGLQRFFSRGYTGISMREILRIVPKYETLISQGASLNSLLDALPLAQEVIKVSK